MIELLLKCQKLLLENTEPEVQEAVLGFCTILERLIEDVQKLTENK